jgi:hypothetical protein
MCGVDLDNDRNNESTSIKNELNEYVSYVSQFTHLSLGEFWRKNYVKY